MLGRVYRSRGERRGPVLPFTDAKETSPKRGSGTVSPEDQQRVAAYAADLAGALARLARANELDMLGYLLDMARLEALSAAGEGAEETPGLN